MKAWDGSSDLPDEDPEQGSLHFSAGALDNVGLRHFGLDGEPQMSRLFRALERVATRRSDADRVTLYQLMLQHDAVSHAGALSARVQTSPLERDAVAEVARWLATEAADLQALPGSGQFSRPLVRAALRSPLINVRYRATRVLASTPRSEWGQDVVETMARAAAEEPDEDVKRGLERAPDDVTMTRLQPPANSGITDYRTLRRGARTPCARGCLLPR